MGVNNPYLPDNVRSDEEAIQFLAMMVNALKGASYVTKAGAGPFTLTAAELVGSAIEFSGATAAVVLNVPTAVNIIAQMLALDVNSGIGSTALFTIINDGTSLGAITVTTAAGVTLVGTMLVAIGTARRYQIKQLTANTVSITNIG